MASVAAGLLSIASGALAVHAQDGPKKDASAMLTGGSTREWLSGAVRTWMGSGGPCSPGQVYTFAVAGKARIEECAGGQRSMRNATWSIWAEGPLDVLVRVDQATYYLLFPVIDGRQHMILRSRGNSKVDPVVDRDFLLSED